MYRMWLLFIPTQKIHSWSELFTERTFCAAKFTLPTFSRARWLWASHCRWRGGSIPTLWGFPLTLGLHGSKKTQHTVWKDSPSRSSSRSLASSLKDRGPRARPFSLRSGLLNHAAPQKLFQLSRPKDNMWDRPPQGCQPPWDKDKERKHDSPPPCWTICQVWGSRVQLSQKRKGMMLR